MCVSIERKAKAIDIFNTHRPLLSQSLSDPVSVAIILQREGVITGQVLASVESASPSVPNQREVLLAAIIVAIDSKYSLLQTFASVLCKFTGNVKLGTVIQRDYGELKYRIIFSFISVLILDTQFSTDEFVTIEMEEGIIIILYFINYYSFRFKHWNNHTIITSHTNCTNRYLIDD